MSARGAILIDIEELRDHIRDELEPFYGVAVAVLNLDDITDAVIEMGLYGAYMAKSTQHYIAILGVPTERAGAMAKKLEDDFLIKLTTVLGAGFSNKNSRYDRVGYSTILVQLVDPPAEKKRWSSDVTDLITLPI